MFALKQAAVLKFACAFYVFNMLQASGKCSGAKCTFCIIRVLFQWAMHFF